MTVDAVVNLDLPGPTISRHVYGHFAEHLGHCVYGGLFVGPDSPIPNRDGIRLDVVEALRAIDIPNLRWPGGCFADDYHWRDGIGPAADRPTVINRHWGDVVENNHFGTHEFLQLCEMLGAEPYISGNVGSGTVQEMSEWIEYLTRETGSPLADLRRANGRERPWPVRFWGLGNETWGCGGNMRAEYYADLARRYGTYCRDHGDNRLYRIAAGANADDYAWTEALMRTTGDLGCGCRPHDHFQAVSLHYYTHAGDDWSDKGAATGFSQDAWYRTMLRARRMDELIARHSTIMDCYDPHGRIGLAVDEWGTWWNVEPGTNPGFLNQQNTLRDALVASLTLDVFHRHARRVSMANLAQAVNVLQAVLLTDGDTLVRTPTYHVFEMNKGHQDAASLPVHLRDHPTRDVDDGVLETVSLTASRRDERVLLSLTNVEADTARPVTIEWRGGTARPARARLLTADRLDGHNTASAPAEVRPRPFDIAADDAAGGRLRLELPPASFVTVELTVTR